MPDLANRNRQLMRRRWLKRIGALAVLTPGGISGLISEALAVGDKPMAQGIQRLRGTVRVNGTIAREGMLVLPGDTLQTGPDSEAIYVLGKDAFLQRSDSIVSFGTDAGIEFMRVVTGKILSVFSKGPRKIQVSTATIGIRGTGCYIEDEPAAKVGAGGTASGANKTSRTYFCLCYGSVELTPAASPTQPATYSTQHHDHPLYIFDDSSMPTAMVPAEVMNHTDLELTMLEALVGRRPPFDGGGSRY
jgi:hypothetical protein